MENSNIRSLKATRKFIFSFIENLGNDQLVFIPDGFRTNILWNTGHILVSQQILNYQRASVTPHVDESLINQFRKGSSPGDWTNMPDKETLFNLFLTLPELLEKDYTDNIFSNFAQYPTSSGFILENIDDSIAYNNFHEGLHLGIIQSILKFI